MPTDVMTTARTDSLPTSSRFAGKRIHFIGIGGSGMSGLARMLVDRETGKGIGITLFESQEAMRRGDAALDAMNPGSTERRVSVEFFEVPVQTITDGSLAT